MRPQTLAAITAAAAFAASTSAQVIWDEAIDGDLSSDHLNPTLLSFTPGSNLVFGDTSPNPNLDPDYFTMQGDELLDNLQNPDIFGGFSGNLGEGTYTFWYQETANATDYGFNFVLTPIPAPASATLMLGGLLLARRRR